MASCRQASRWATAKRWPPRLSLSGAQSRDKSLRLIHASVHHKAIEIVVQKLAMLVAVSIVVLSDSIGGADQDPAIQHSGVASSVRLRRLSVHVFRLDVFVSVAVFDDHAESVAFLLQCVPVLRFIGKILLEALFQIVCPNDGIQHPAFHYVLRFAYVSGGL